MTTEAEQMLHIQKTIDYNALKQASEVVWLPPSLKEKLVRHANTAKKLVEGGN